MKRGKTLNTLLTIALGFIFMSFAHGQCDTIATLCNQHIYDGFISDGQSYRALLVDEEVAEFHTTFFGGSSYRIAACSGLSDGNLIFSIFDQERNLLFTNSDQSNAPFWNFEVTSTLDCIIEARLDLSSQDSGCAVLLISFKE